MFVTWELDLRRRAGHLDDVKFFIRELATGLTDDEEDVNDSDDKDNDGDNEGEADDFIEHFDNGDAAWDLEHQPPNLNEDETFKLIIVQSKFDQLA
jgi:hypothetical protein